MGRRSSRAILRAASDTGREFGVTITETDIARLAALGRWYTLSSDHLARAELDPEEWHQVAPNASGTVTGKDAPTVLQKRSRAISERFAKLARIIESGSRSGPLVDGFRFDEKRATWFATPYGATEAELPWNIRSSVNPQFVRHAWFAADVGMQLERLGHIVHSEREVSSGTARDGLDIETRFASEYTNNATGRTVKKKPDVVVASPFDDRFIAIEVENDKNRSLSTYTEKLAAYQRNTDVAAVWYVCSSPATANRVGTAANSLFGEGSDFPLRISVVDGNDGWMGIEGLTERRSMMSDLEGIQR